MQSAQEQARRHKYGNLCKLKARAGRKGAAPDPPIVGSCCFLSVDNAAIGSTLDRSGRMNCLGEKAIRLPRLHAEDEYATECRIK